MNVRTPAIIGLLNLLLLTNCAGEKRQPRVPEPGKPALTVLTYNVNYGLAGDPPAVEAIRHADADVVFLQETTAEWEDALRSTLAARYPNMAFRHCCGAGGLAVLSKVPFEATEPIPPTEGGWFPAWRVILQSSIGAIQVLNVHLRPAVSESGSVVSGYFSTPPLRRAQIENYYAHLDPSLPTLVVGDFNEGDGGKAITYLESKGFRSALPEFDGNQDTWHWPTSIGTVHAQLDHIVYDDQLEPLEVRVLEEGRSDHFPVWGVFQRKPTAPKAPR